MTTRDRIDGQRTVRLPHPEGSGVEGGEREFALVKGRRWTRVFEYLSNGQLTARAFVDEATREVREAAGAKRAGHMMGAASAQFFLELFELPAAEDAEKERRDAENRELRKRAVKRPLRALDDDELDALVQVGRLPLAESIAGPLATIAELAHSETEDRWLEEQMKGVGDDAG